MVPSRSPRGPAPGRFLLAFLALAFLPPLLHASRVRPVNLEEMTRRADRIFSGRCVEVEVRPEPDLGREVTWVTLEVDRAVKGEPGRTVTLKLLGAQRTGPERGTGLAGMPRFQPGEEVILFLYAESSSGLTSPVGLGQGKFRTFRDKRGGRVAVNGLGNRGLFRGLSPEAEARLGEAPRQWKGREGIPPGTLLGLVEALGRGARAGP